MLQVTHYTDPACPWAFSAEPQRQQLRWHYGDQLAWRTVMIGLAEDPETYIKKGFTTDKHAKALGMIQGRYGMPISDDERARMAATVPACRAVVATRLNAPELEQAILRRLRVRTMRGELLDEQATIEAAAEDVGISAEDLRAWVADDAVERALRDDIAAASSPKPAALVLDHKLADAEAGGRRYTAPSYELASSELTRVAPGFQPWETYDAAIANLGAALGIERRPSPSDVHEVLDWAIEPLATAEIAALLGTSIEDARAKLTEIGAEFEPAGLDGYWTIAAA